MGQFDFVKTSVEGLYIIEPKIFEDARGYFMETYNDRDFRQAGLDAVFVQDNQSKSKKGVVRGLHFQKKYPQCKLVRVLSGEIFDVVVDVRKDSPTYKKWFGILLSDKNRKQLYIPIGFAHGFMALSDVAEVAYKCTDYYYPEDEGILPWNDPEIGIEWPLDRVNELILSPKDQTESRW